MKRAQTSLLITIIVLIVIVIIFIGIIFFYTINKTSIIINNSNNTCDYNSNIKSYITQDNNCIVNFLCSQGSEPFKDICGCGCEKTNIISCNSNNDCGGTIIQNKFFCKNNNVYKTQIINTCNNPGASNSYCSSVSNDIISETCSNAGCSNGECITQTCDYNSQTKNYIYKNSNCVINFLCTSDRQAFHDNCGCGCELITPTRTYCTKEQKQVHICPQYAIQGGICGWFNQSIQCLRYPCANNYANQCIACADPKVEYYTNGPCPQ